jgi:lycopene cyclase domain-containing protein
MINTHFYYLLVDVLCVVFPFLLSFHKKMAFFKKWRALGIATILMMTVFIPWDILFTHLGVWEFNSNYISGFSIVNLPVEEWLFFICIPYSCLFTHEVLKYYFPKQPLEKSAKYISVFYIIIGILFAITHLEHYYTLSTSLVATFLLFMHTFIWKSKYMGWFHLAWSILLIPFYISNGVLTGLEFWNYPLINLQPESISDQIVWYNNSHNLGIRIWSVPLDDFFYGMAMVLMTLGWFEKFSAQKKASQ